MPTFTVGSKQFRREPQQPGIGLCRPMEGECVDAQRGASVRLTEIVAEALQRLLRPAGRSALCAMACERF
jgi:hypothetical protein